MKHIIEFHTKKAGTLLFNVDLSHIERTDISVSDVAVWTLMLFKIG